MTPLDAALQKTAGHLLPHRDALVESWVAALSTVTPAPAASLREFCAKGVDVLLGRLSRGEVEALARKYNLRLRKVLRSGGVLRMNASQLAVLQNEEGIDHLSGDIRIQAGDALELVHFVGGG